MSRASRFRLVCNGLAFLMLLVALRQLVDPLLALADPLLATAQLNCSPCAYEIDPVRLMDGPVRKQGWQIDGVEQRILDRLEEPLVPWLVFGAEAVRSVPLFFLFLGLAVGVRSFAAAGFSHSAMRWFRVSAVAAIFWTVAGPISRSMRASAFDVVITGVEGFRLPIDFYDLVQGILIAGAALVAIWAVEEAMAIQSSAEEIV